jgi:hypothetical protein
MKTPKKYWLIYDIKNQRNASWTDKKPASVVEGESHKVIPVVDAIECAEFFNSIVKELNFCPMDFYDTGVNPDQAEEICAIIAKRLK